MKYSCELVINLPRAKVIELFDDMDNLVKWQDELVSFKIIEGKAGQVGAKAQLTYNMGKRQVVLIETITKRNLPEEFCGTYTTHGMSNVMENYFTEKEGKTHWKAISEFKGENFTMKAMLFLMPGMFKKRTLRTMGHFKQFAEST